MSTNNTSKNILNSDVEIKGNIKSSGELTNNVEVHDTLPFPSFGPGDPRCQAERATIMTAANEAKEPAARRTAGCGGYRRR